MQKTGGGSNLGLAGCTYPGWGLPTLDREIPSLDGVPTLDQGVSSLGVLLSLETAIQ